MPEKQLSLTDLRERLRQFSLERDWNQFHTPKNLAMALCVEAAELLEHFQWLTAEQSLSLDVLKRQEVAHEVADVLIYLTRLADVLSIDPLYEAFKKIDLNAEKYPIEKVRGSAKRPSEL